MGIFIVTATSTNDDYTRPHSHTETKMATSHRNAVTRAVELYLEEVHNTDLFTWHDSAKFKSILGEHTGNFDGLMAALHSYFDRDEGELFVGEYVPTTFYVTIGEEQEGVVLDQSSITNLITEIQETLSEQDQGE